MNLTIADGVLALIVLIGVIIGLKQGFFKTVTKPLKTIIAIALTVCFALPVIDSWTGPYFTQLIEGEIFKYLTENCPEISAINAAESLPLILTLCVKIFGVQVENITTDAIITELSAQIAAPTGRFVAMVITYVAMFIVFKLILSLLLAILGGVVTAGPLSVIDKLLGFVFMVAVSFVVCCIVANIISYFATDFSGGFVYEFFKNLNPLALILSL
jgi:uncharacterized membrane protein required for colicin V production